MMGQVCAWILLVYLVASFFAIVHGDFHPRQAKPAAGFPGFVATCIVTSLLVFVLWGAGAFDKLW